MKHFTAIDQIRKEETINKTPTIHKQIKMKRNEKMAKTKNRIKKMIFQTQDRKRIPLSEEHKYILARRETLIGAKKDEILLRTAGGPIRSQHI